ncbi:hypothetical protein VNI00_008688 [Paramarasmius palmivorus]|uniref:NAD(P)-binding protein n=1 Tax=Paramarasmius palmivorus TaxID=297713 RepID=A0AAW0CT71_9AGAR
MFWSKSFDPLKDVVDLSGKVAIVTGGNRGTGYATVQHLLRAGAKVYMAARDEKKANEAIENLKKDESWKGKGEVVWLKLDLSDPREAKKAAEEFLGKEKRLDILGEEESLSRVSHQVDPPNSSEQCGAVVSEIHCDWISLGLDSTFEKTPDGPSNMVTVNYTSPFIFTETLLPLLKSTALEPDSDVRIVNVSSAAHKYAPTSIKFQEIDDLCVEYKDRYFATFLRYGHSKLLEILWTKQLQKRLQSSDPPVPITVISLHPGAIDTFSNRLPLTFIVRPLLRLVFLAPERGAHTSVFAAAAKTVRENKDLYKGVYLEPEGVIKKPTQGENEKLAEDLYQLTKKFFSGIGIEV